MRILILTNMYPSVEQPAFGTFVHDQVESLRLAGVEVDVLSIDGRRNKLAYLWGIGRFWRTLLAERYDLVHAHYAITGFIARLQITCPVVVTYHGGEVKDHSPAWLRALSRRGPRIFDRILVTNQIEREILGDHPKVRIVPCGVNLDRFTPTPKDQARQALGLPPDRPLVLWAGEYWQWEKRFGLVESSLQTLKERLPDVELVLVSGKPHSQIPTYMSACDVLILTSRSEGSPMVVKEAMACNLPVISTDVGDVAQVIGGTKGCYLVEPNPEAFADKLETVLTERERTNGREHIQHLAADAIAQRIIAVYKELLLPERTR